MSDYVFPTPQKINPIVPDPFTIEKILSEISKSKKPVILAGGGLSDPLEVKKLSERLDCPVATTYLHNDRFPASDSRFVGI